MDRPARVGGFSSRTQAVLAQGFLADQGITATVVTDDAGGAAPFVALGSHGIALLVPARDADRARALLAELAGDDTDDGVPTPPWLVMVGRVLVAVVSAGVVAGIVARAFGR